MQLTDEAAEELDIEFAPPPENADVIILVAPLVDIVFLLVCFYLLVAQLVVNQKDPTVELPAMSSPLASAEVPAEIVINIRQDGSINVDGHGLDLPSLVALLQQQAAQAQAGAALRVVVRADRRQQFARLGEVLKACRGAGLNQVVFRASLPEEPDP